MDMIFREDLDGDFLEKLKQDISVVFSGCKRVAIAEKDIPENAIYIVHPIDIYGTALESTLIGKTKERFPGQGVENPAKKHHGENYGFWKEKTGNGMEYFARLLNSEKLVGEVFAF